MIIGVKEKVIKVIYSAIDELNQQLPKEQRLEKSPDTILLVGNGKLDSLAFINLIIAVEQKVEEEFKIITLTDEIAMLNKNSPFKSISSLAEYIMQLL